MPMDVYQRVQRQLAIDGVEVLPGAVYETLFFHFTSEGLGLRARINRARKIAAEIAYKLESGEVDPVYLDLRNVFVLKMEFDKC